MAISNCLFLPTLEIPNKFLVGSVHTTLTVKSKNAHSLTALRELFY